MTNLYKKYFLFGGIFLLGGCSFQDQGIKNTNLRDKVIACGAGFSEAALGTLGGERRGDIQADAGLKISTEEIIFSELPPEDRLNAYKDYIRCIKSTTFPLDKKTSS
ncbi:MAG: hypothetical protein J0H12_01180 [Candidatus Paracaedimonas acanthamoebae]|uniref:Lipoprotein n=1 Tax=Candidatus Paracaedimonas acanthamoebae TaxID=244581 RepID=A0A8J7PWL5_9PROT|nr:hypothetical protein [Candidatus Paracaedimonas acanthamoebae]